MENLLTVKMIDNNREMLKGRIFTGLQLKTLRKKIAGQKLNSNEKTYYYKYIKPKVMAMLSFFNLSGLCIMGREYMQKGRREKAAAILRILGRKHKNQKIMVSGSFLFSKKYNDVDVFIFSKYAKEDYTSGRIHVNFLPEAALDSLFFSSISQISVSNFAFAQKDNFQISLKDLLQDFEVIISFSLGKKPFMKELRNFLLASEYISKGVILNPRQLYWLCAKVARDAPRMLPNALVNTLLYAYPRKEVLSTLRELLKNYSVVQKQYHNARNIPIYIETYREAIAVAT